MLVVSTVHRPFVACVRVFNLAFFMTVFLSFGRRSSACVSVTLHYLYRLIRHVSSDRLFSRRRLISVIRLDIKSVNVSVLLALSVYYRTLCLPKVDRCL